MRLPENKIISNYLPKAKLNKTTTKKKKKQITHTNKRRKTKIETSYATYMLKLIHKKTHSKQNQNTNKRLEHELPKGAV